MRSSRPVFQQLYARMPAEWQETEKGDDMADGLLYDAEGESHHLSELQGRYILLDFWSIYCGPCRMSEPEMEEIAHLYGDKLALVGISNDEKTS
ncbi:TlpA family protein disulfide reductase [Phocaeicola coprophilus]